MDWAKPLANMRRELGLYLTQYPNLRSLVLGVSGGIDSALVAAIVRPVCDSRGIKLIGRSLPASSNKPQELTRANAVGDAFCHEYWEEDIGYPVGAFLDFCEDQRVEHPDRFHQIAAGNIKARTRMIILFDLAYQESGMVLSTDNLTELLLGFWTLNGDVGNYGLIQNLWKTEVYDLSKWIRLNELHNDRPKAQALEVCELAVPTDGLGITSSDLEQLGAPTYLEVDNILKTWLCTDVDSFAYDEHLKYPTRLTDRLEFFKYRLTLKDHPVVLRHQATHFKRQDPTNVSRDTIFHGVL